MYTFKSVDFNPFEENDHQLAINLNDAQKEIWLSCAIGGEAASLVYNECTSFELKGKLNAIALEKAVQDLVDRHQALRCNVSAAGDKINIYSNSRVIFQTVDLSNEVPQARKAALEMQVEKQVSTPFDLLHDPLLRVILCKMSDQQHVLIFTIHHIVGDGWSQRLLFKELSELYAYHIGKGAELSRPTAQMSDFLTNEDDFNNSEEFHRNEAFWHHLFKDSVPETNLITDFPRKHPRSFNGARVDLGLPQELLEELKVLSVKRKSSLTALFLAAFEVLISKKTAQQELVIALPAAGQSASGFLDLVGHYVTTLPLMSSVEKELSFLDYLDQRKLAILQAIDHQQFSLRELVKKLQIPRESSRIPLIPIVLNVDLGIDDGVSFPGIELRLINNPRKHESFELFVNISGTHEQTTLECSYNSDLFKVQTIQQMMDEFCFLLKEIVKTPHALIKDLLLQDPQIKLDKLQRWNDTFSKFSKEKTLLDYFEKQASENPKRVALSYSLKKISYRELNERANQFAHLLLAQGVVPGNTVAIVMSRSPKMIISLLAVLKCGATFVPIDPEFPKDRVIYMLEDSNAKIILTTKAFEGQFSSSSKEVLIEEIWNTLKDFSTQSPAFKVKGNQVAYILYTSGSTGKPKGVQILHSNLLNFLLSMQKAPGIQKEDKMLATTTISFDISMLEIFLPLISGAQIVLLNEQANRNGKEILAVIKNENVTIMQGGPALYNVMLYEDWNEKLPLKVLCGGEAFPKDLADKLLSRCAEVWNMYGPTETTVWSTIKKLSPDEQSITIGKPIDNTQVYILDETHALVPEGQAGEIYIAGDGLALGYLNRAELTAEKFIRNPYSTDASSRMYGTGDMGMRTPNGEIQCLGRLDHQIKIRGIRIELGEIEQALLQKNDVKEAIVVVREGNRETKNLCAYVIVDGEWDETTEKSHKIKWREELKEELPIYMVPHDFVVLSTFPLTPNGKIDRNALPSPDPKRPDLATLYTAPNTEIEKRLTSVWTSILHIDKVGIEDNFFDVGGDSLLAVKSVTELRKQFDYELPITKLYQFPTIEKLAALIEINEQRMISEKEKLNNTSSSKEASSKQEKAAEDEPADIAVIGMAGRFPKSNTIDEFWSLLKEGQEGISFFSMEELDSSIPEEEKNDPSYVRARGIVSGIEDFEPGFFGINPRLAELMDPQQRIFLEICWEALEETGYTDQHTSATIGVFAGAAYGSYFLDNVQHHKRLIENTGSLQVQIANEKDYLSSRVAYALNLKGPAITVQSACSTSLLAIAQAVESLRGGKCDLALAGGVSMMTPIKSGHIYQEGSMQSADGHCRPFDSEATGTVFSDGAGVVLLKPLHAARRDGDTVFALVKGIGITNDGAGKGSFTAPSTEGQAKAINMALQDAKVNAESISYIETHGTATPLGDPIEFEGLKLAFNTTEQQFCAIGSVKGNIGHLNTAAGVTGFIKTCLALHHEQIPASINYVHANPHIDFENSPFYVNTLHRTWTLKPGLEKRRAGVSSFGVGGTNVHIILEEAGVIDPAPIESKPFALINWSAKSEASKALYAEKLLTYLESHPKARPIDVAYSLQRTRSDFHCRRFLIASTRADLIQQLREPGPTSQHHELNERIQEIVFMFPGQGSQYINMGKDLYGSEPAFKSALDECALLLEEHLKEDIRLIIFPAVESPEAQSKLNNTYYTQPALFIIEYAVSMLLRSWGIQPSVLMGHSIGEFVAAHLSGIFTLKEVLFLISTRGKLMAKLPPGKMLAIRSNHEVIQSMLPNTLSMAAINSPGLCVVAGATQDVADFSTHLEHESIANTPLHTSHAFHSAMMDEIVEPYAEIIRTIKLRKPIIPIVSTVTGTWMSDEQAQDPQYWASHLRSTVNFSKASITVLRDKKRIMVECGPRNVLSTLLKQHGSEGGPSYPTLHVNKGQSENQAILMTLGQLWLNGLPSNWKLHYSAQKAPLLRLPCYAFNRKRYWVNPIISDDIASARNVQSPIL